ncbi:MAG: hypothetical protein EAZ92_17130 [Candidatus Kapaibacterium sp.]|nr:MAG: hypothetical protein EAZ92_17130 [Candidatus Kapabacteria bacterium]
MNTSLNIEQQLSELGYTPLWQEYSALTAETLALQYEHWNASEDGSGTEHYRYASFRRFLHNKTALTDTECEQYAHLARIDADSFMAGAAMVDILRMPVLTEKQFFRLAEELSSYGAWTGKIIEREREKFLKNNHL